MSSFLIHVLILDGIFLSIKREHVEPFISVFNSYNKHLQFTHEIEDNNRINFLDPNMIKDNNAIINCCKRLTQQKGNIVLNFVDEALSYRRISLSKFGYY